MIYSAADLKKVNQFIENLHLPEKFGISGDDCYEQEFEDELDNLFYDVSAPFNFHVNYGASKVAVVSEELPFVIKIPFNGMWYVREEYDEEKDEYIEVGRYFEPFQHAGRHRDNYCEDELLKTLTVKASPFNFLVPEMDYLDTVDGHPVYLQQRVNPYNETSKERRSSFYGDTSLAQATSMKRKYRICNDDWLAAFVCVYGMGTWEQFVDWNDDVGLDLLADFHGGNFGYRDDGTPVIFDISGFRD